MTAPAYWLTFEDRPGYLLATVQGIHDSLEVSIAFWQEILTEAHQRNPVRLLVEESFTNNVSTTEQEQVAQFLGESFASLNLQQMRVAFCDTRPEQHDQNLDGATSAALDGVCCKVFTDFTEAEQWLLSEEPA